MNPGTSRARAVNPIVRSFLVLALCSLGITPHAIAFMSDRNAAESDSQIAAASTKSSPFKITGRIVGLVPGQQKSLRLKVVNGNRYAIRVKWVAVRANTSTKSGCAVPALELPKRQKMSLRVPARKSAFAVYPIRLKSSIPSECQLAQWPLRYTGQAVRVP